MKLFSAVGKDPLRVAALLASTSGLFAYLRICKFAPESAILVALALLAGGVATWIREVAVFGSAPALPKPKKDTFDWGMHYMRGFAIVCIMLMHVQARLGHRAFTTAFFSASTVYFLFISGYLCQYLALKKPLVAKDYYTKKATNVLLPYVLCSLTTAILVWLEGNCRVGVMKPEMISAGGMVKSLLLGQAQYPYWYIPFVTVLFAVSPLLTRLSLPALVWCATVAFIASLVFPARQGFLSFNLFISGSKFTFFTVYYLIGFLYARLRSSIDPYLKTYAIPALLFAFALGLNSMRPSLFPVPVLESDTFKSLQKGLLIIPLLVVAGALKHRRVRLLDTFAEYSFTLFFLHYFFIQDYVRIQIRLQEVIPSWILDPILIVLFVFQNLAIAVVLKKAFGRWSRFFIGS